jgi:hypothetical protein
MANNSPVNEDNLIVNGAVATYDFIDEGDIAGSYKGVFKFNTCLSPMELIYADRDLRQLIGDNPAFVNTEIENLAYALSQLKYRVIEAPPFWKENNSPYGGAHIKDTRIINHVFAAAIQAEIKFRDGLKEKRAKAKEQLEKLVEKRKEEQTVTVKPKE